MSTLSWQRGISELLAKYLQPIADNCTYVLRNTDHLISRLQQFKTEYVASNGSLKGLVMGTIDVENLYPSIDIIDLKKVVYPKVLAFYGDCLGTFVNKLIQLSLSQVIVEYHGELYHHIQGLPTGAPESVALANIYLAALDSMLLRDVFILVFYARYVDDIYLIFKSELGEEAIDNVTSIRDYANKFHSSLKMGDTTVGTIQIPYLDLSVTVTDYNIHFSLFSKPKN
eukprot:2526703-Amphidinium_carterae.1